MGLLAKILGWDACPSGVDLTFATHSTASSSSECQILNSTRNLSLRWSFDSNIRKSACREGMRMLESDHRHAVHSGVKNQAASDRPLVSGSNNAARMIRPYAATVKIPMAWPRGTLALM